MSVYVIIKGVRVLTDIVTVLNQWFQEVGLAKSHGNCQGISNAVIR